MTRDDGGYFSRTVPGVRPGDRYFYVLDGREDCPDPVSRFQPEGPFGPSEVVDPSAFRWSARGWKGLDARDLIFYEFHVGTFTPEGTLRAAIGKIPHLKRLGITCVEIMPVSQFPGRRNWGYDGVFHFAPQNSYGRPEDFKAFVDACHRAGLAVCLDVVYNHFGPEGNHLGRYGHYFTSRYRAPWGDALNFDGRDSDPVREFVARNAVYWTQEYRIDVLRLDAIDWILDRGARHILADISDAVHAAARKQGRRVQVIAESDLNDSRVLRPEAVGGYALDGQWSDDFHHGVHRALTGEAFGYYQDFSGMKDIARAMKESFVYDGRYSAYRRRRHGNSARDLPGEKFVVCVQNHDQIGNRAFGDRHSVNISFEAQKLAAAVLLVPPCLPLIFMGQEYGEEAPFQYFVDHRDPALIQAVQAGRTQEFAAFGWTEVPDPAAEKTFLDSKLRWETMREPRHAAVLRLYRDLIALKRSDFSLRKVSKLGMRVAFDEEKKWIAVEYPQGRGRSPGAFFSFDDHEARIPVPFGKKALQVVLHTDDLKYGGPLSSPETVYRSFIPRRSKCAVIGNWQS